MVPNLGNKTVTHSTFSRRWWKLSTTELMGWDKDKEETVIRWTALLLLAQEIFVGIRTEKSCMHLSWSLNSLNFSRPNYLKSSESSKFFLNTRFKLEHMLLCRETKKKSYSTICSPLSRMYYTYMRFLHVVKIRITEKYSRRYHIWRYPFC